MDRLTAFISFFCLIGFLGLVGAILIGTMAANQNQFVLAKACVEQQGTWVTPDRSPGMCLFGRTQ